MSLLILFFVLILNSSGLKSSKLTNFEVVADNVLSILNILFHSFYIVCSKALDFIFNVRTFV